MSDSRLLAEQKKISGNTWQVMQLIFDKQETHITEAENILESPTQLMSLEL